MKKGDEKKEVQQKKKKPYAPPKPQDERKEEIKKEKDREKRPFMQVDKSGDMLSNFLSNFLKQLKNPTSTGLGKLLVKLAGLKVRENGKEPVRPSDIMGPVKTVFRPVSDSPGAVGAPSQNKSLRQRTSQSNNTAVKQSQDKEQAINKPRRLKLGM